MKTTTCTSVLFAILVSSCTTVYYTKSYEDANYLTQDEFAQPEDYTTEDVQSENTEVVSDTSEDGTVINNYYGDYYEADDYYDFSYSARIKRFHRPVWSMGYYGGLYTDYYWYSYNPYHCGLSIYYGYNYNSFYSPYYSWGYSGYYSPYYSYYNYNHYGHHHHYQNDTYSYNNSYDNNSVYYGPRGSLSSKSNSNRSVKSVVGSINNKTTTYDKFNRAVNKKITQRKVTKISTNKEVGSSLNRPITKSNTTKSTTNRGVKTNAYKGNRSHTTKSNTYKSNSKSNRTYTNPKSNPSRSYNNSRGSATKNSNGNRNSGSSESGKRSVKPRK